MNDLSQKSLHFNTTPAIVIGCCGHGLSIIRALKSENIPVIALEANRDLPGLKTNSAIVLMIDTINETGLINELLDLRIKIICPENPVLFLTNDRMVDLIGKKWDLLKESYSLSWSDCIDNLLPLLDKDNLEEHCNKTGNLYPETIYIDSIDAVDHVWAKIGEPMIIKPAKPLSGFKTFLPESKNQLIDFVKSNFQYLPFLAQRFIPGDDQKIFFSALFLDKGNVLARFDGHKLRSRPLGHTTVAESYPDNEVYSETIRFFEGSKLSGPVSLELKRDLDNKFWVIEPTVGRTDFWLGLCVENKINLPAIEFKRQLGLSVPNQTQKNVSVWFNEERDPFGMIWFLAQRNLKFNGRQASFLFMNKKDLRPMWRAVRLISFELFGSLLNRARKLINFYGK